MKNKIKSIFLTAYFFLFASSSTVNAGLLTDVYFNQLLFAANRDTGTKFFSLSFSGASLPASGQLNISAPNGGFMGAIYTFTDTGSIAIFDINTLYTVRDSDSLHSQSADGNTTPILFTTTQPVFYTISVMQNVWGSTDPQPSTASFAKLSGGPVPEFDIRDTTNDHSDYMTGSLPANKAYYFQTLIDAGIREVDGVMTGQARIVLTLTSTEPGLSPDNPLMPLATHEGWEFNFNSHLNQETYIDPIVATGYDYIADVGSNFASVLLPSVGNNEFALYLWNSTGWVFDSILFAGVEHAFGDLGVDRFRIGGIETSAGLDPNDTMAFVTGLKFVDAGPISMHMIPIAQDVNGVPEPGVFAMVLTGLGLMGFMLRRRSEAL